MRKFICVIALLLCPILLVGCATIVSGKTQKLPVNTIPDNAKITVNNVIQSSPCVLVLDRTVPTYQIKIEKEGYKTVEITLNRSMNGWILGNILFGGIIGLGVDCMTSSVYEFTPNKIEQTLIPDGQEVLVIKAN